MVSLVTVNVLVLAGSPVRCESIPKEGQYAEAQFEQLLYGGHVEIILREIALKSTDEYETRTAHVVRVSQRAIDNAVVQLRPAQDPHDTPVIANLV